MPEYGVNIQYLENIYRFENCTLSDVDCSSTVLY